MNCKDIYNMKSEKLDWINEIIVDLFYEKELEENIIYNVDNEKLKDKITVKNVIDYCFDGRRIWGISTFWFENEPFAILQRAGREGTDYNKRFITNRDLLYKCVNYILSLQQIEECEDIVNENYSGDDLTYFYGHDISDFVKEGYEPIYKNGDIVEVTINYNGDKETGIVLKQKECRADAIVVELDNLYVHKNDYRFGGKYKNLNEINEDDLCNYVKKLVNVDDNLKYTYR